MASLAISLATGNYALAGGQLFTGPIRAGRTKHGPRRWGKIEYAQRCIVALIPGELLKSIPLKRVYNIVIPHSAKDPDFKLLTGWDKLTESTVKRALQALHRAIR
jgi:hypothetical protein